LGGSVSILFIALEAHRTEDEGFIGQVETAARSFSPLNRDDIDSCCKCEHSFCDFIRSLITLRTYGKAGWVSCNKKRRGIKGITEKG